MSHSNLADLEKLARLAKINLSEDEKLELGSQLEKVLNHFESIQGINTGNLEPLFIPNVQSLPTRDDVVAEQDSDELLECAPSLVGRLHKVPPVV